MVLVGAVEMAEGEGLCVSRGWRLWFSFLDKGRGQRLLSMENIRVFFNPPTKCLKNIRVLLLRQSVIFNIAIKNAFFLFSLFFAIFGFFSENLSKKWVKIR
jgi:hypothetical protein